MTTLPGRRLAPHFLIGLALPLLAGAGAGEDENWLRLGSMPREQRVILAAKIREFDLLSRDEKAAVRALDEKIGGLPAAEQSNYRAVLRRYHRWLQTLTEEQRTQLADAATHKEKLALLARFREGKSQATDQGSTALLFQLADLHGRSPFEVAQMLQYWFSLGPEKRAEIENLGVRDRMKRLFDLSRKVKLASIPHLSEKVEAVTSEQLDKSLQTKGWLRNQLKKDSDSKEIERHRLVNNYYFVANPPKPVASNDLLQFESTMPSWIRTTFDHLTPEEARRRLTILYRLIHPPGKETPPSKSGKAAPAPSARKPAKPAAPTPRPSTVPPI